MPTYLYQCSRCEEQPITITKPMTMASQPEPCPVCRRAMERVYTVPAGHVVRGTPGYHRPR